MKAKDIEFFLKSNPSKAFTFSRVVVTYSFCPPRIFLFFSILHQPYFQRERIFQWVNILGSRHHVKNEFTKKEARVQTVKKTEPTEPTEPTEH